ncbi:MAG: oxidoreductase [Arenicella sp.]|nr:oxidoreductase [Arenicella sp.]
MSDTFRAIVARERDGSIKGELEDLSLGQLPAEDTLVKIDFSTLNYKDALAVTGRGKICRRLPMVCGIDLSGEVVESSSDAWNAGDKVLVNGFGMSEKYWGGYSQFQRVKSEWLVRLPQAFSAEQVMAIGTAGYTAMLSVNELQDQGVSPEHGKIVVSGATGGVGSVATMLLARLGYEVTGVSGKADAAPFLKSLGAKEVISRADLDRHPRPLENETWAGAVDAVGSGTLATILAQTKYGGVVTCCGLAGGADLPATVMPFILRGVKLCGIDSVMAPQARRQRAWDRLSELLDLKTLLDVYKVIGLEEVPSAGEDMLLGRVKGRIVVDVNR